MSFNRAKKTSRSLNPNTIVLIRQIMVGVLIFGFVGGLLLGIWYGTRVEMLTLRSITVSGGETINHDFIRERVGETLAGTYLGIVPRRFAWLYPREDIVAAISALPRVARVELTRESGTTLTISVTEHIPAALWCADRATTTCAFLDESGYAFAIAPPLEGGGIMRLVSLATSTPAVGTQLFSTADMDLLMRLTTLLAEAGWLVSHIEVDAVRDVFVWIVGGGEFKATLTMAPEQTVANLRTVLTAPEFAALKPGTFSYIDLRFGNKVFVNQNMGLATTTASSNVIQPETNVGSVTQ